MSTALTAAGFEEVTVWLFAHTDGSRRACAATCSDCIEVWIDLSAVSLAVSIVLCWVSSVSGWRSIDRSSLMIELVSRPVAIPPTLKSGVADVVCVLELVLGVVLM